MSIHNNTENTISWWRTDLGEEEKSELVKAFSERRFTISSSVNQVESLASSILNVPYVLMTNSGSSALLMALLAIDINPDDEVIPRGNKPLGFPEFVALNHLFNFP
jgi:dTDP-4-amino-4,6-dideoxygalactose transaminase